MQKIAEIIPKEEERLVGLDGEKELLSLKNYLSSRLER